MQTDHTTQAREVTLKELVDVLRSSLREMLAISLFAGAATYLIAQFVTPIYRAEATLVVATQNVDARGFGTTLVTAPTLDLNTYRNAVTSRPVLRPALALVEGVEPSTEHVSEFADTVVVAGEGGNQSATLRVRVDHPDPTIARDRANAIAASAIDWDERRATKTLETIVASLQGQIDAVDAELAAVAARVRPGDAPADASSSGLQQVRADLALQLSTARALRNAAVGRLELLEAAIAPQEPISPRPLVASAIVLVLSGFASYLMVLFRHALSNRIRDVDGLVRVTGLAVLAEFPRVTTGRRGLPRESASYLRTSVDFATVDAHPKILLVTSPDAENGKSSVAIALAESYARQGGRVLLLDADLRKPVLGREYGLHPGAQQSARDALGEPTNSQPTPISLAPDVSIHLLPGFEPAPDATELIGHGIRPLLDALEDDYDVIVIDSAPIMPVADTLSIAPFTSGVVFVASLPDGDQRTLTSAVGLLRRLNVRLIGMVASNLPPASSGRTGGYGFGYGYGPLPDSIDPTGADA